MTNWNPSYPEVLGLEWWPTQRETSRVYANAPGRMMRMMDSTTAETVDSLKMSATVNPLLKTDVYTIVDVYEEGDESPQLAFETVELVPSADDLVGNWTTQAGGTTNLYQSIDDQVTRWPLPGTTQTTWIQNTSGFDNYRCHFDATEFDTSGDYENARIGFVEIRVIAGANTGIRQLMTGIRIGSTEYAPVGNQFAAHAFGAQYTFWFGELNPATELPWTPADIADFGSSGSSSVIMRALQATAAQHPRVNAVRLFVYLQPVENRAAVGVWRRPENLTEGLVVAETDSLVTMPAGTADWSKADDTNYVYFWRQAVTPSLYGPTVADDVRWNGAYQYLHSSAQPGGMSFPLTSTTYPDLPTVDAMSSNLSTYDQFGRPTTARLKLDRVPAYTIVPMVSGTPSVDSQPYRHDLDCIIPVLSPSAGGQSVGQRVTMPSTQSYVAVRFPVIPPAAPHQGSLSVTVRLASTGAQVGTAIFTINANQARALPAGPGGVRYVQGILSSAVSLTNATQYEIQFTSTSTSADWLVFAPSADMAPSVSFGGTTDCLRLGSTSETDHDLCVTLVKQPDSPTNVAMAVETVAVAKPDGTSVDVEHVRVTWDAPAVALSSAFRRYELERQIVGEDDWVRVANINSEATLAHIDHLVPRSVEVTYRIRSIATDGRFGAWSEAASSITVDPGDYSLILTSNHVSGMEAVLDQERESNFEFRSDSNTEVVELYGADYQVVFEESEERGVTYTATVEVNAGFNDLPAGQAGLHAFDAVRALLRSTETPHICILDWQGTKILGHAKLSGATQSHPGNVYKATIEIFPTHDVEVPVEVE